MNEEQLFNRLQEYLQVEEITVEYEEVLKEIITSLGKDLLIRSTFYSGDLLMMVLEVKKEVWLQFPKLWEILSQLINEQFHKIEAEKVSFEMKVDWYEKIERFSNLKSFF